MLSSAVSHQWGRPRTPVRVQAIASGSSSRAAATTSSIPAISDANGDVARRIAACAPIAEGVGIVGDVLSGFKKNMILTSGALLPWSAYEGPQRRAIIGGALFEGLATTEVEVDEKITNV